VWEAAAYYRFLHGSPEIFLDTLKMAAETSTETLVPISICMVIILQNVGLVNNIEM
jgi:hypothetical protein